MLKNIYPFIFVLLIAGACGTESDEKKETEISQEEQPSEAVEITVTDPNPEPITTISQQVDGDVEKSDYEEFYEDGQLKIEGNFDENGARHGLWNSYYESSTKWSESYYVNGVKSGHSVTFFPNGKVRYIGEYKDDKQFGHWRFYDEEGNLVKEEDY